MVRTRRHDEVIDAALSGDVRAVIEADRANAELLNLPPYGALARVSGASAEEFVAQLGAAVSVRRVGEEYVVRAGDLDTLCDTLNRASRPPGRLRVAVE